MKTATMLIAVVSALLVGVHDAAAATKKVTFILTSNEARYTETRDAILEAVGNAKVDRIQSNVVVLDKDKSKAQETIEKLAPAADIFVVMGSVAAVAASKVIKDKPVIFSATSSIPSTPASSRTGSIPAPTSRAAATTCRWPRS